MADIVRLLMDRNEKGLSQLYDSYAPTLLGLITGIVKNQKPAEEILQQTILKAWNNISSYDPERGNLFAWLATIARNNAIDHIRLKGFQNQRDTVGLDQISNDKNVSTLKTATIDAQSLLSKLDVKHQEVLQLVYLQGYTHRDASEMLNIPLGTVKTRIRLAINTLRSNLENEKSLFVGLFFLVTLLMIQLWT